MKLMKLGKQLYSCVKEAYNGKLFSFYRWGYIYLLGTLNSRRHSEEMSGIVGDYAKLFIFT